MKYSILGLERALYERGYNPIHVVKFLNVVNQILQKGAAEVNGRMITAAGIRPLFKINPKSIDVYLNTTEELDLLRIHHPDNTWFFKDARFGADLNTGTYLASKRMVAKSAFGAGQEEWNKKYFRF